MAAPRQKPRADRPSPVGAAGGAAAIAERRCLVTGESGTKADLVRFVIDPGGHVVPDISERLPGRGLWLRANEDIIARAVAKGLFGKAARRPVSAASDLARVVEAQLARQCVALLGLARRSGQATSGFEKVQAWLRSGMAGLLVEASDGAPDGRRKVEARALGIPVMDVLTAAEIGEAFGRERQVHAALSRGGLAARLAREAMRLAGFRRAGRMPDGCGDGFPGAADFGRQ